MAIPLPAQQGREVHERRRSRASRRMQIQFLAAGHRAIDVQSWLDHGFPHLNASVRASPGLAVTMSLPAEHFDAQATWYARMMEANSSIDLMLEILLTCFEELQVEPSEVLAVHLTREL